MAPGGGRYRRRGNLGQWGDWIIGGAGTDSVGTLVAGRTSWFNSVGLAHNTPVSWLLVQEPTIAGGSSGAPVVGEVAIMEVAGSLFFNSVTVGNITAGVGVAIYVSEYNSSATQWSVRDPLNVSDASRDDYLFLRAFSAMFPLVGTVVAHTYIEVPVGIPAPESLGTGEALILTVNTTTSVGQSLSVSPFIRSRIGRVA